MKKRHKDKTLACLLAILGGWAGAHRFYLHGRADAWGWTYVAASLLYLVTGLIAYRSDSIAAMVIVLLPLPVLVGMLEGLVLGVREDRVWDARHNAYSGRATRSRWPLAVLLVLALAGGFVLMVAGMARVTDLLYTGGSFG